MLSNVKCISTGPKYGISKPCGTNRCKTCPLMSGDNYIRDTQNQKKYKTAAGCCKTQNCIYSGICKLCGQPYVGKSIQQENKRIDGHRDNLKIYAKNPNILNSVTDLSEKDKYSLATHLNDVHNIVSQTCLDDHFKFTILEKCTPRSIDLKEHLWIQKLNSLAPFGLNLNSPLGFPLLL